MPLYKHVYPHVNVLCACLHVYNAVFSGVLHTWNFMSTLCVCMSVHVRWGMDLFYFTYELLLAKHLFLLACAFIYAFVHMFECVSVPVFIYM